MKEETYQEVRAALAKRDLIQAKKLTESSRISKKIKKEEEYWYLLMEGEIQRYEQQYDQGKLTLEKALEIHDNLSLTPIQVSSLYGRYAYLLLKLKEVKKSLKYYKMARTQAKTDVLRKNYYSTMILNCYSELGDKTEYLNFIEIIMKEIFSPSLSKNWSTYINLIWEVFFTLKREEWEEEFISQVTSIVPDTKLILSKVFYYYIQAHVAKIRNNHDLFTASTKSSLAHFPSKGKEVQKRSLLANFASIAKNPFGDYHKAKYFYLQALKLSTDNNKSKVFILNSLGTALRFTGEYTEAIQYLEESIAISQHFDDYWYLEFAYNMLGMVYTLIGDLEKANDSFQKSLTLSIEGENYIGIGYTYGSLGWRAAINGNLKEANQYYSKAIESFKKFRSPPAIILLAQAEIITRIGEQSSDQMNKLMNQAKTQIWERKSSLDKGRYFITLGNIAFYQNNLLDAEIEYKKALNIAKTHEIKSQGLLGLIKLKLNHFLKNDNKQILKTIKDLINELKLTTREKNSIIWYEMELILSLILIYEGNYEDAQQKLEQLLNYSIEKSFSNLQFRIKKHQRTLNIFQTHSRLETDIESINEQQNLRKRSLNDVMEYLKSITHLISSFNSDSNQK